ncbi:hypothetical protein [Bacillus infantis]|uniref:hypothetical protein n=1 Tax=Bacillus infantis TaxID=324767 RepID=UPI003CEEE8B7
MANIQCSILKNEKTIRFAKEELQKYAEAARMEIPYSFVLDIETEGKSLSDQVRTDSFKLLKKGEEIQIIGSNPRSVLFGIYHACKKLFGYKWVSFLSAESLSDSPFHFEKVTHRGKMERRGLVVENYNDAAFLINLVDWAAKHYINDLFFTFMLWDKVKNILAPEIEKRGLTVTIGGHSMHYLAGGSASEKNQFDFRDDTWKSRLLKKIKETCEDSASIKRVSLWPADVGIGGDQHFIAQYIEFTETVKRQLPHLEVEHIAYNAGLSWNMLELPEDLEGAEKVDTLFAYWGRNYKQSFADEVRAYKALQNWCHQVKESNNQISIFEYYSDHFMLGDLYPPLFHRIQADIELFSRMGIKRIVNLIVPFIPKESAAEMDHFYPWQSIQLMNSYFFARLAWGDDFHEIKNDFYSIFGDEQAEIKEAYEKMEEILSEASKMNVPLFPQRIIDPEKVTKYNDIPKVLNDMKKWKIEIEQISLKPTENTNEVYSMAVFYIDFIKQKLTRYITMWEEK